MRVVHVGLETSQTRSGGLNRYLEALLAAERATGLDATAVVLGDDGDAPAPRDGVVVAGSTDGSLWDRARSVDRAVAALGRADVADLHFAGTSFLAVTTGSLRRVPLVVHFQGPWADESAVGGSSARNVALKRAIERAVYRRARRFVVLSSSFAGVLSARYGVAPWAIDVVPPGVDLARFSPGDPVAARATFGLGEGRVVLCVRRLVPRMGIDVLLRAWAALRPGDTDTLVVVGDGPSLGALTRLADALGIRGSVRFLGRVDDVALADCYRAADVTVVPSVALEGFGLVVLESLACGTPVIGTDIDGLAEALQQTGQAMVRAGDVGELAEAIRAAISAERPDARADATRAVATRFGWEEVAERHREIYEAVVTRDEPLRVVVLDHTALLSGGELAIARALQGVRGSASVHAILAQDGPLRARLAASGATVEVLELDETARSMRRDAVRPGRLDPRATWASVRYVVRLARRLRMLRPDVVHTNSLKSALYGGVAARLAGVPCVWHVRDMIEAPYLPTPAVRLVRGAARVLPSVVVANSASTLRTVGVAGGRIVPSPLDPSIRPSPRTPRAGDVRFTVMGRLAPWKGQDLAIEAFAEAFPVDGASLRVVGSALFGEEAFAASLPGRAGELGVADRVRFDGFVDDVATVLEETDVVVHSSVLPEPFGQVVIEAMGARCAVIVADAGGPADVVTNGVDGLVYPMADRSALAAAMRRLAEDEPLRARLGDAGVLAAAAYTPSALAPDLLDAWREAIAGHRRGPRRSRG